MQRILDLYQKFLYSLLTKTTGRQSERENSSPSALGKRAHGEHLISDDLIPLELHGLRLARSGRHRERHSRHGHADGRRAHRRAGRVGSSRRLGHHAPSFLWGCTSSVPWARTKSRRLLTASSSSSDISSGRFAEPFFCRACHSRSTWSSWRRNRLLDIPLRLVEAIFSPSQSCVVRTYFGSRVLLPVSGGACSAVGSERTSLCTS